MSVRETSGRPVGFRSRVPEKITSSMRDPRNDFADCSPNTQEIASAMFDLPQPFGPMMAAMPSPWNLRSVRSQNDLNPRICSLLSLSKVTPSCADTSDLLATSVGWSAPRPHCLPFRFPPLLNSTMLVHKSAQLSRLFTNSNGEFGKGQ